MMCVYSLTYWVPTLTPGIEEQHQHSQLCFLILVVCYQNVLPDRCVSWGGDEQIQDA